MSIVIRDVREHELDSVLALNNAAGPAILPLDAAKLRSFFANAEYFRVAERDGTAGRLPGRLRFRRRARQRQLPLVPRAPPAFFYIDRIVVASRRRGGGVGRAFYADVQSYAELRYPQLACEVLPRSRQRPRPALPRQLRLPRSRPARDADGTLAAAPAMLMKELCSYPWVRETYGDAAARRTLAAAPRATPAPCQHTAATGTCALQRRPIDYEPAGELKIGQVGIANLRVRTLDVGAARRRNARPRAQRAPKLFARAAVVVDFGGLTGTPDVATARALVDAPARSRRAAGGAGLRHAATIEATRGRRSACRCWRNSARSTTAPTAPSARTLHRRRAPPRRARAPKPRPQPAGSTGETVGGEPGMVQTAPVRSGQQVYAENRDLTVRHHRGRRRRSHRRRLDPHLRRIARPRTRRRAGQREGAHLLPRIPCRTRRRRRPLQGAGRHSQGTARQGRADLARTKSSSSIAALD